MLETRGISIVLLLAPFEEYTVAVIIPAEEKAGLLRPYSLLAVLSVKEVRRRGGIFM